MITFSYVWVILHTLSNMNLQSLRKGAFLALVALSAALMPSCKKDNSSGNDNGSSKAKLLTASMWTFQKFEYQKPDGNWIPDPDAVDADKFTLLFSTNGTTFEHDLVNQYIASGNWSLSSSDTVLTLTAGNDLNPGSYNLVQLTSSILVLTHVNYPGGGAYTNERLTFTH